MIRWNMSYSTYVKNTKVVSSTKNTKSGSVCALSYRNDCAARSARSSRSTIRHPAHARKNACT